MRVREPVARPLDIVAVELLLTASQAFLSGVLLYLAVGLWNDVGVGLAGQAVVLAVLGLGVGGSWLYWLLGGVGWPMAAANAAAGLFLAFMLVMDWSLETFDIGGVPLVLGTAAAVFGVIAGVFLDSPRRWRWDQREKLRPGTRVPRVTATTAALAAQVPRSLPRRPPKPEAVSELAARIGASAPSISGSTDDEVGAPGPSMAADDEDETEDEPKPEPGSELSDAPEVPGTPLDVPEAPEPVMPTARLGRSTSTTTEPDDEDDDDAIKLPTMIEPRAQRSPWAWAAPPDWNRDEDDEGHSSDKT